MRAVRSAVRLFVMMIAAFVLAPSAEAAGLARRAGRLPLLQNGELNH